MKNGLKVMGGCIGENNLYGCISGKCICIIDKDTGIVCEIVEHDINKVFLYYSYMICDSDTVFLCPFFGKEIAMYREGELCRYDLGVGYDAQIIYAEKNDENLIMLSSKNESFIFFNIKTKMTTEKRILGGMKELLSVNISNNEIWIKNKNNKIIHYKHGKKVENVCLYNEDIELYIRDGIREYYVVSCGELWKKESNIEKKIITDLYLKDKKFLCIAINKTVYIVFFNTNLIYILSTDNVCIVTEKECRYINEKSVASIIPIIVPDKYAGKLYIYSNDYGKYYVIGKNGIEREQDIVVRIISRLDYESSLDNMSIEFDVKGLHRRLTLNEWLSYMTNSV